jgi:hypothetical protein
MKRDQKPVVQLTDEEINKFQEEKKQARLRAFSVEFEALLAKHKVSLAPFCVVRSGSTEFLIDVVLN